MTLVCFSHSFGPNSLLAYCCLGIVVRFILCARRKFSRFHKIHIKNITGVCRNCDAKFCLGKNVLGVYLGVKIFEYSENSGRKSNVLIS